MNRGLPFNEKLETCHSLDLKNWLRRFTWSHSIIPYGPFILTVLVLVTNLTLPSCRFYVSSIFCLWWLDWGGFVTYWVSYLDLPLQRNCPLDYFIRKHFIAAGKCLWFTQDAHDLLAGLPDSGAQKWEAYFCRTPIIPPQPVSAIRLLF